jgi:hypothetical protein
MKNALALLAVIVAVPALALDLTPRFVTVQADGVAVSRPYFQDGGKKFAVTLDTETEVAAIEGGVIFRFTKLRQADMRLLPSSFDVSTRFEGESLARYETAARAMLPAAARDVTVEERTVNPWPINDWEGFRVTFSYRSAAGAIRESIVFLNITPAQQVVVRIASPAKDFPDASQRAFDTIRRWHEVDEASVAKGS